VSFITGSVGKGRSLAVLAQVEDEDDEPVDDWRAGFWWDGEWTAELELDFKPVAVIPYGERPDTWAVLGYDGEVLWIDAANTESPNVRRDQIDVKPKWAFTTMRPFAKGLAVAQMSRQVYWSNGSGWTALGTGIPGTEPKHSVGIEALAALGDELYAAGWAGEIWYMQNRVWKQASSPTNVILTGAAALPDGQVLITGRLGTILRGQRDRWAVVAHEQTEQDFWSAAVFGGKIYVSFMSGIFELVNNELTMVDDEIDIGSYYHLSSNDQIMASIGAASVAITDGQSWEQIA
jgi:hypothetical protein